MAKKRKYKRRVNPDGTPLTEEQKRLQHLEHMRLVSAEQVAGKQEIGPLPAVVNPERKESCRFDLMKFGETYLRSMFRNLEMKWAKFHYDMVATLQRVFLEGGLFAEALPRGSVKTGWLKAAVIWAGVYGHCGYTALIDATQVLAVGTLESVKTQLEVQKLLQEDFPEVCHPIKNLERKAGRCKGQKLNGVHTRIRWSNDHVVFPTVPGAKSSGFRIVCSGITGSGIRGLVFTLADGTEIRPDAVVMNDFQTTKSATSVKQTRDRLDIIQGAICGMAAPGRPIAVAAAVTVIAKNDGADQLLAWPDWQGMRHGILTAMPTNLERWREYRDIQKESFAQKRGVALENEFYAKHRAEMDAGCEATWFDRFNPTKELSAIQAAMNIYFRDGAKAFWAEYMNQPQDEIAGELFKLDASDIRRRINRLKRFEVPLGYDKITMQIDVQMRLLWYVVTAWRDDFTGAVIDYGWCPEQNRRYFTLDDLSRTLQGETGSIETDVDSAVSWGLERIGERVIDRTYLREDGVGLKVSKGLIDIGYTPAASAIARFCRLSKWASIMVPARGWSLNVTRRKRISQWTPKDGERFPRPAERAECEWMMTSAKHHQLQEAMFDTNHWKGRMIKGLTLPLHSAGSISLYGDNPDEHGMLAEHLTSHYSSTVDYNGTKDIVYTIKPGVSRDDLFDGLVGSAVAASIEGVRLGTERAVAQATKKRVFALPPGNRR